MENRVFSHNSVFPFFSKPLLTKNRKIKNEKSDEKWWKSRWKSQVVHHFSSLFIFSILFYVFDFKKNLFIFEYFFMMEIKKNLEECNFSQQMIFYSFSNKINCFIASQGEKQPIPFHSFLKTFTKNQNHCSNILPGSTAWSCSWPWQNIWKAKKWFLF